MSMSGFQTFNSRAAKVNGEMVVWIRKEYAKMVAYPQIREGLRVNFGVVLSVQQITRIAKGHSFSHIATIPTDREVDLTMHLNAVGGREPTPEEITASQERLLKMLERDNAPRESVLEILENRGANSAVEAPSHQPSCQSPHQVPTLKEVEARERALMGVEEGSGLEKLMKVKKEVMMKREHDREREHDHFRDHSHSHSQLPSPIVQQRVEKLLDELKLK